MARKTLGLRRNLKEDIRRAAIINAAVKVFSERGYDHTTMDDIASEAGFSKSLIYWYWKNKASLFSELIDLCMKPYCDQLQKFLNSDERFTKRFNQWLWEFGELHQSSMALNKLVHFASLHSNPGKDENFKEKVNGYYNIVIKHIEDFFQQGVDSGDVRKGADLQAIALTFMASVEGYLYMSILQERMPVQRALLQMVSNYIMPNILVEKKAG